MKREKIKKFSMMFLSFIFIFLLLYDFKLIERKKEQQKSVEKYNKTNTVEEIHKNYKYSDMLTALSRCSNKFVLNKINKDSNNKDYVSTEIQYKGELNELINGLDLLRKEEILKNIEDIEFLKVENEIYVAKIDMDFYKIK